MPLKGAAENVVQLADHQCAFRAQAGNSPLQGQSKLPAKPVVLTVVEYTTLENGIFILHKKKVEKLMKYPKYHFFYFLSCKFQVIMIYICQVVYYIYH